MDCSVEQAGEFGIDDVVAVLMGCEVVVDNTDGVVLKFWDGVGVPHKSLNASCEFQSNIKKKTRCHWTSVTIKHSNKKRKKNLPTVDGVMTTLVILLDEDAAMLVDDPPLLV